MDEIEQLLKITASLKKRYGTHNRGFTLDGKLVGDIGEVLVAEKYGIELYKENKALHDGFVMKSKKEVQIKSSFSFRSYFPTGDVPAHIICIQILSDGSFKELFNGTGEFLKAHYVLKRNLTNGPKKQLYTLSGNILKELNEQFKALHPKGRVEALEK